MRNKYEPGATSDKWNLPASLLEKALPFASKKNRTSFEKALVKKRLEILLAALADHLPDSDEFRFLSQPSAESVLRDRLREVETSAMPNDVVDAVVNLISALSRRLNE